MCSHLSGHFNITSHEIHSTRTVVEKNPLKFIQWRHFINSWNIITQEALRSAACRKNFKYSYNSTLLEFLRWFVFCKLSHHILRIYDLMDQALHDNMERWPWIYGILTPPAPSIFAFVTLQAYARNNQHCRESLISAASIFFLFHWGKSRCSWHFLHGLFCRSRTTGLANHCAFSIQATSILINASQFRTHLGSDHNMHSSTRLRPLVKNAMVAYVAEHSDQRAPAPS